MFQIKELNPRNNIRDLNAYIQDIKCIRNKHNNCYKVVDLFCDNKTIVSRLIQPLFDFYYNKLER